MMKKNYEKMIEVFFCRTWFIF